MPAIEGEPRVDPLGIDALVDDTLLSVLDRTVSAPGGRLLREWLRRPLTDPETIAERQQH